MNKVRYVGIFLTVCASMAFANGRLTASETFLMERAQRMMPLTNENREFCWLSDHELLTVNAYGVLSLRDFRAKTKTVPGALNRQYHKYQDIKFIPSPNSQWVMYPFIDYDPNLCIARRDGTQQYTVYAQNTTAIGWMPDSRRWVEVLTHIPNAKPDTVPHNSEGRWIAMRSVPPTSPDKYLSLKPPLAAYSFQFLGARPGDRLYFLLLPVDSGSQQDPDNLERTGKILVYHIEPNAVRQTAVYPAPPHYAGCDNTIAVSPDGSRLLWQRYQQQTAQRPTRLHPRQGSIKIKSWTNITVWTSRVDGSHKQEVGRLKVPDAPNAQDPLDSGHVAIPEGMMPPPEFDPSEALNSLQWLPDSKRITFRHNDGVYTLAVDNVPRKSNSSRHPSRTRIKIETEDNSQKIQK